MRIVITGATGFIGSNLARVFLEQGAQVYALVRPGSLHMEALPVHERLHAVPCDLAHVLDCVPAVGQADGFFHMAWGGVNRE
ncbi:MAG: NAD-dependent epimerase/dehydratase family protein, partial [Enterocloster clostridioformis]|nr:NAD-dependent epimerase/dehydratase family protein [Enterocloster clostridioformis]